MPTYRVADDGSLIDKETGNKLIIERGTICAPMIISDIQPYRSPVSGEYVGGRAAKREDLKKHDCVDANELRPSFGKRNGVKSEKWAKRLGLPVQGRDI
jgi:hypothetical protein